MTIYLNPSLRIELGTVPASATVRITFPDGRVTYLKPPPGPPPQDDCALGTLNIEERKTLEDAIRALRPGTERNLPWLRDRPIPSQTETPAPAPPHRRSNPS